MLMIIKQSQDTYTNVTYRMKVVQNTKKEIQDLKENYRAISETMSILFFTIQEMKKIDSIYDFTFEYFMNQFWIFLNKNYTPAQTIQDAQLL